MNKILYNKINLKKVLDINGNENNENFHIEERIKLLSRITNVSYNLKCFFDDIFLEEYDKKSITQKLSIKKDIKLSINIMTYNEERCIKRCLDSIVDIADEIVILDTGSSDNTIKIIKEYNFPIKLINYLGELDFSVCRNLLIDKSGNDWIFSVDADEYLNSDGKILKKFISIFDEFQQEPLTISPKIICGKGNDISLTKRIFNKRHGVRFYGAIHEDLIKIDDNSYDTYNLMTDFIIYHDGYNEEIIESKNKIERNLKLIYKMLKEDPENIRWYYYYGREMFLDKSNKYKLNDVIEILDQGLDVSKKDNKEDNKMFELAIYSLLCNIFSSNNNWDKLEHVLKRMDYENLRNSDYFYYYNLLENNKQIKNILKLNSEIILNVKKMEIRESFINSNHYHLYKILGINYFLTGKFDLAKKILGNIRDDFYIKEIENILLVYRNQIDEIIELFNKKN